MTDMRKGHTPEKGAQPTLNDLVQSPLPPALPLQLPFPGNSQVSISRHHAHRRARCEKTRALQRRKRPH